MHGRGVYRPKTGPVPLPPKVIDVAEDASLVQRRRHRVQLTGLDMVAYRNRVHRILQDIIDENATLQKIKAGLPVEPAELESLCSLVLTLDAGLDLHDLADCFPETARHLDQAIRGIIGLDAHIVHQRFARFVQQHPHLASHQIKFLDLLQNHIARYGSIQVQRLYEPPFTLLHTDSLDGLFEEPLAEELREIIGSFSDEISLTTENTE